VFRPGLPRLTKKEERAFFFEKAKQKTSINACGAPYAWRPETARALAKVFGSFFKKNFFLRPLSVCPGVRSNGFAIRPCY
jgi:hypothetical protein